MTLRQLIRFIGHQIQPSPNCINTKCPKQMHYNEDQNKFQKLSMNPITRYFMANMNNASRNIVEYYECNLKTDYGESYYWSIYLVFV